LASTIVSCLNYIPGLDRNTELQAAKAWWMQHGKPIYQRYIYQNNCVPGRPLRIGYLSADMRRHSVAYFLKPLLAHHDHSRFAIYCYANVARPDTVTTELKQLSNHWRDITASNTEQAVRQIMKDGIDILVDLTGHMINNRLDILAKQAAPIQISWLGYPNTTGLPTIHYRLTDAIADPPGDSDPFYTEQLIRQPVFLCYEPPDLNIPIAPPPSLKNGYITFGSFNNPAKINSDVITAWASILRLTPHSRLLLKGLLLGDKDTRERYTALFAAHGINRERLDLIAYKESTTEHLNLYNDIDICLDTFPYNGTTTTFEALWMGLPVIVLRGDRHASRVGASILTHIGLPEFIAPSPKDYTLTAAQLARDPATLRDLRQDMRPRLLKSPFCQAHTFTGQLEATYLQLWKQWCQKLRQTA
jgi:predicted O-linked N-acetylglucosamine transferase (SPINDLY family)